PTHQTLFSPRRDASDRDWPKVCNRAKRRRFISLQLLEPWDYRRNPLRTRSGLGPIRKKTITEVFVNYAVLILDYLFAAKNPRSDKNVQVLALHLAAQRRKPANVRH